VTESLHESLGAGPPAGVEAVTLFIPSVDRNGGAIEQGYWVEAALETFGRLFRGATAFPPGRGVWRDDDKGGELIYDDTQMVTSWVAQDLLTDPAVLNELKNFLWKMGREANQGEIGIVIDGTYFGIVEYEEGADG
jgi:hypothetical protein